MKYPEKKLISSGLKLLLSLKTLYSFLKLSMNYRVSKMKISGIILPVIKLNS